MLEETHELRRSPQTVFNVMISEASVQIGRERQTGSFAPGKVSSRGRSPPQVKGPLDCRGQIRGRMYPRCQVRRRMA
eukprot:4879880-Pyramimonas_sp.AAC.1